MTDEPFDRAAAGPRDLDEVLRLWAGLSEDEHLLVELALIDLADGVFASVRSWNRFVAAVVELRAGDAQELPPAEIHALAKQRALTH